LSNTKDTAAMAAFYHQHFGFTALQEKGDRIVELLPSAGGPSIMPRPLVHGRKDSQTLVKLIFGVRDVAGFCTRARQNNLVFGPVHKANGYEFANAKDPDGHPIQVSSRIYRKGAQRNRPSP
jgi:catechol 2,3-dioxygenase-like lactoylglutathione lyase family enzyme